MIFIGNGLGYEDEVEGKGGVGMTEIDEVVDMFLFFKEVMDVEDGFRESRGLEHRGRHCIRRLVREKLVGSTVNLLDNCLRNPIAISSSFYT